MKRVTLALTLGLLSAAAVGAGMMGVGSLMGTGEDGAGGGAPANAIATEADDAIMTEDGQYLVTEP